MKEIISTNIVWESPDVSNDPSYALCKTFIRDMGNEYRIDSPCTHAVFDKTDMMLYGVIDAVEKYGNLTPHQKSAPMFSKGSDEKRTHLSLVQIIAAIARGVSPEYFKGKRFRYRDGNHNNLHTDNIWCSGHALSVFTFKDKRYIVLIYVCDNEKHFAITNYTPQQFSILNSANWYYDKNAQEITLRNNCKLKHIVWAHFRKGATTENIDTILEKMKKELNFDGSPKANKNMLVIDHKIAEAEKWDTRIENLQIITHAQNGIKNDCTSRIGQSCFYFPTDDGETYGRFEDDKIVYFHRNGEFSDDTLTMLRHFYKTGILPDGHIELSYDDPMATEIHSNASLQSELRCYGEKELSKSHRGTYLNCILEMEE